MALRTRINGFLDTLPRARVRLGSRSFSTFFVCGSVGAIIGHLLTIALIAVSGGSALVAVGLGPLAVSVFVVYGLLRARVVGEEVTVLHEHVALALGLVSGTLALAGLPVGLYLDASVVGLCVFLACGRLGCTLVGCCYGRPAPLGIVYPPECSSVGQQPRRFPVQLLACASWIGLAVLGAMLVLGGSQPGNATALVLLLYGEIRLGLEFLRGDPRARFLRLNVAQWAGLASMLAGGLMWQQLHPARVPELAILAAGLTAAIALTAMADRWLSVDKLVLPEDAAAILARLLEGAEPGELRSCSRRSLTIGARASAMGLELSLRDSREPIPRADAARWFEALLGESVDPSAMICSQTGLWLLAVPGWGSLPTLDAEAGVVSVEASEPKAEAEVEMATVARIEPMLRPSGRRTAGPALDLRYFEPVDREARVDREAHGGFEVID